MQGLQYLSLTEHDIDTLSRSMSRAYGSNEYSSLVEIDHAPWQCDDCIRMLQASLADPDCLCFKVCMGDEAIGAFVIHWNEFAESELRHMFVAPKFQNKGIGRRIWLFLQSCYPTQSWRVETPSSIERNMYFYQQVCGFQLLSESSGTSLFVWRGEQQGNCERTNDRDYLPGV